MAQFFASEDQSKSAQNDILFGKELDLITQNESSSTINQIAQDLLKLAKNEKLTTPDLDRQVLSEIEIAILQSIIPIEINESDEITVNGQHGIWANKSEIINWKGVLPIEQYLINQDQDPEIIRKKSTQKLDYVQELAIRYLRPPTPPTPGEIIINQLSNTLIPPAPPLILRQQPPRPSTPEPLILRESPPEAPKQIGRKVIIISGKRLPPPPRKVVIERLAPLPPKPQAILIERWLPYPDIKRRVIFNKSRQKDPVVVKPKNIVVQWEAPEIVIKQKFHDLGIIRANPAEYVQRYGTGLKNCSELPDYVRMIRPPEFIELACDKIKNHVPELYGDVDALNLVDLDNENLSEYKNLLGKNSFVDDSIIESLFSQINLKNDGKISLQEAEKILLKLNCLFGRNYGEAEALVFYNALEFDNKGVVDLNGFKNVFKNLRLNVLSS